jgi:hypothetical protein
MGILKKLCKLQVAFFHTHSPNGFRYLCLGLKPLGCSISNQVDAEIPLPNSLKSITGFMRSLLDRVIDLHKRNICHGGMWTSCSF